MDNISTETKSKGRGRPKADETSANLWEDPSHRKDYNRKYYEQSKAKTGMSKCEECGFECASNYMTKHKKTKYHLQYVARKVKEVLVKIAPKPDGIDEAIKSFVEQWQTYNVQFSYKSQL